MSRPLAYLLLLMCAAVAAHGQGSAPSALRDAAPTATLSARPAASAKAKGDGSAAPSSATNKGLPGFESTKGPITTEIYADAATFDSSKYIGVFTGHVIVNDPRFNVQADKLTIFINKEQNEGLDRAIAEGNVGVVRDRPDPNGGPPQRAVGRAAKAIYTTKDGNVELSGSPRVQQGVNSHIATSPDTVMILNENGQLQTRGPSRTEIRQEPKPENASATPSTSPTKSPAAATTKTPGAQP